MFNIVLFEPEIPPNTGNIIRLCVNSGCTLHLIRPLGFNLTDKSLRRAGLDYKVKSIIKLYDNIEDYLSQANRVFLCTTKATQRYTDNKYQKHDSFIFGQESRGLPQSLLDKYPSEQKIIVPMTDSGRSLNLATTTGIVLYEAWRQLGFDKNTP